MNYVDPSGYWGFSLHDTKAMQEYAIQYVKDFVSGFANYIGEKTGDAVENTLLTVVPVGVLLVEDLSGKRLVGWRDLTDEEILERQIIGHQLNDPMNAVGSCGTLRFVGGRLGSNLLNQALNKGRSANKLRPDSSATGAHSVFKRDPITGKITNYETYIPNSQNPTGFDLQLRYDGIGKPHTNPFTGERLMPHIHDKTVLGKVRAPFPWEIPLGGK